MEELSFLYFAILPFVMAAAIAEGLWLSRTRAGRYDWKAWASSLADLIGRRILAFIPYTLAAAKLFLLTRIFHCSSPFLLKTCAWTARFSCQGSPASLR